MKRAPKPAAGLEIIPVEQIERRIYLIRGQKVMLDATLAEMYEVETRVLLQAVKRNLDRFPKDFMFRLEPEEADRLRSQTVISKPGRGGRRYLPYVFTEQGVASDRIRVFSQLKSGIETGRTGGPRPTDEDRLDLSQAFVDVKWPVAAKGSFTLRVGRHEMIFGSSRIISFRGTPNVQLAFDGVRAILKAGAWRLDALAVEPVQTKVGTFDDGADSRQRLWGLYAVTALPGVPGAHLDLYFLTLARDVSHFDQGSAREQRHSLGARVWGGSSGWDYNFEFIYQGGTFGTGRIEAWTVASDTGYTFSGASGQPRISLKADVASGDHDPNQADLQSFNPLFPRGSYFNESGLVGPVNFIDLHPGVEVKLTKELSLFADWDFFWRESVHDGIYGPPGNLVRSGRQSDARYVGHQPGISMQWHPDRHWLLAGAYAHFFAGDFLRATGPASDVDFATTSATYRF